MSPRVLSSQSGFETHNEGRFEALSAGERFASPQNVRRGSTFGPAAMVIAVALGGIWGALRYPELWQTVVAAASSLMERGATLPPTVAAPPQTPLAEAAAPPLQPDAAREVITAPGAESGTAAPAPVPSAAETTGAAPPVDDAPAATATPEPLTPPQADPKDPNQKRALAAGLHPDLSRALLARMTPADYRNAAAAIKTALTATAPDEVYRWPPDAGAKRALFEVHFVQGAGPECRRYVVTVTLERWSTTAPAMEKCGAELAKRKAARAAAG
ncbi:MAG: hypothetical protein HOP09_13300 [Hyphomicrobium sp.]|nr:hypothetical protein [Hyphomicrobium sp.]